MSPVHASAPTIDNNPTNELSGQLRAYLQSLAARRLSITYWETVKEIMLLPPNTIRQVAEALEQTMIEDADAGRPFLAAVVISKWRGDLPAPGFFYFAAHLGRYSGGARGLDARMFQAAELKAVLALWGPPSDFHKDA